MKLMKRFLSVATAGLVMVIACRQYMSRRSRPRSLPMPPIPVPVGKI